MKYPAAIMPGEASGYVVTCPDLPGVVAHGDTPEKAIHNAEEPRMESIEARLERGWPIPELGELASCNGNLSIRIPRSVHRALRLKAKAEGVSLNQLTPSLLSAAA